MSTRCLTFRARRAFSTCPTRTRRPFRSTQCTTARAYYWLREQNCEAARAFAHSVYRAYFRDGRDIADVAVVLELATRHGADRATLAEALNSAALKERLKAVCDAALAKGVFGSPYISVDGEPFFGADRLPQIERWLATGGF